MKKTILLILISLIFSSCATLLNSRTEGLTIVTNEPSKIQIEKDTIHSKSTQHYVAVERSKDSLEISAFTESKRKTINVKSSNSFAYWLNLYPSTAWTGFLIDKNNPKRYTYPKIIYIDLNQNGNNYLKYKPLDTVYSKYNNILKITPLKTLGVMNSGLEISYEKKFSNYFTTQFTATYLFPVNVWDVNHDFKPNIKGFQLAIEEKFYFKRSAPIGPYISLEFNYLKNQYHDIWHFETDDIYPDTSYNYTNYSDTFGIKKQTFSLNFKLGYQIVRQRFSIDLYAGLGIRYKDVVHFDRIKPEDKMEIPRHPNFFYITNKNGQYWTISIPLNIRIGWTF
jgi:hypothetical protein